MKAQLYVMGIYQGEIEVGEAGILGLLAQGRYGEAAEKAGELQRELDELGVGRPKLEIVSDASTEA